MSELDKQQIFCDLERCSKQYKSNEEMESECLKCTYHGMGVDCVLELISDSFSLVKELLEEKMTWRETYDTVLKYFRSKGDKEAEAKARSKPMQYYEDNFADEIIDELATK